MIYVECNPDKVLIKTVGIPPRKIRHAHSKGNVCNSLMRNRDSIGVVDEDPTSIQPRYINKLVPHYFSEYGIKVLYDNENQNVLVLLCPRLEEWILQMVNQAGVNIEDYGLPNDADKLHEAIVIRARNFENLMEDMKRKSKMLETLKRVMEAYRG